MGHIQRYHLTDAKVVLPDGDVMPTTNRLISPLIEQVLGLRIQSRTLAAPRDTLLPKLISGELRVQSAEGFAGASAS